MEKIQLSEEQEQHLLMQLKKNRDVWLVIMIIGIAGFFSIMVTTAMGETEFYYSSPTWVFFVLGIIFTGQREAAMKKIKAKDYLVYKAECKKVSKLGTASVDNNDILSKSIKKPLKSLEILGSTKSIQVGDEIGILQVEKDFLSFSLDA